ncbi:hypothetical protein ACFQZC_09305 [Streptacidiphilus monticola]
MSRLDEARAASTLLAELRSRDLPLLEQAAERLAALPGFEVPEAVGELASAVIVLARLQESLAVLRPEAYDAAEDELRALAAATASSAWRAERGVRQSWWQRSRLTRRARRLAAGGRPHRDELHRALDAAATARAGWAARAENGGTRPELPSDADFLEPAGRAAEAALSELEGLAGLIRPDSPLEALSLPELTALLDRLAADESTLFRLPALHELRETLSARGLDELLVQLAEQRADLTAVQALFPATEEAPASVPPSPGPPPRRRPRRRRRQTPSPASKRRPRTESRPRPTPTPRPKPRPSPTPRPPSRSPPRNSPVPRPRRRSRKRRPSPTPRRWRTTPQRRRPRRSKPPPTPRRCRSRRPAPRTRPRPSRPPCRRRRPPRRPRWRPRPQPPRPRRRTRPWRRPRRRPRPNSPPPRPAQRSRSRQRPLPRKPPRPNRPSLGRSRRRRRKAGLKPPRRRVRLRGARGSPRSRRDVR